MNALLNRRIYVSIVVCWVLFVLIGHAYAMEKTGVFTNVWQSDETGDLGGYVLTICESESGYVGQFVVCEGSCSRTYDIQPVFEGTSIAFDSTWDDGYEDHFRGELDDEGITITSYTTAIGKPPLRLLRKKDAEGPCRSGGSQ